MRQREKEVLTYSVPWLVSKRLAVLGFPWPVSEEKRNVCVYLCVFLDELLYLDTYRDKIQCNAMQKKKKKHHSTAKNTTKHNKTKQKTQCNTPKQKTKCIKTKTQCNATQQNKKATNKKTQHNKEP